jgi:hypothetical protein
MAFLDLTLKTKFMNKSKLHFNRSLYGLLILAITGSSCSGYFKPVVAKTNAIEESRNIIISNAATKYFILRPGINYYAIKNISIDSAANTLNGTLTNIDDQHYKYVNATDRDQFKYYSSGKKHNEIKLLNEIHIYTKNTTPVDLAKPFVLPLNDVDKIEFIEHDTKRTNTQRTVTTVALAASVCLATLIVVNASNGISSIPF